MKRNQGLKPRLLLASLFLLGTNLMSLSALASNDALPRTAHNASSLGQNDKREVKGFIGDENGEPIIGATVRVRGTSNAAITNSDGTFIIHAVPNAFPDIRCRRCQE